MPPTISLKWSLVIFGFVGIVFFLTIIFPPNIFYVNPVLSVGNPVLGGSQPVSAGFPVRLVIPAINVNAAIEYVGVTPQGAMAVPACPTDTAWFDLGPRPGEKGSAVIAGHEGWKDGIWAVFDDLNKLRPGDKIYVEDQGGVTVTFVVNGSRIYDQNGDASDIFNSNDGMAHLNLITCEGTWNADKKSYSNRLVVFTTELGATSL